MAIDKRGPVTQQMAALNRKWRQLESDVVKFSSKVGAHAALEESQKMRTFDVSQTRSSITSFSDLVKENKALLERRTALVNQEKLLQGQRLDEMKDPKMQERGIREAFNKRKHSEMKIYLETTLDKIKPTVRERAGAFAERMQADIRSVASSQRWLAVKDTVGTRWQAAKDTVGAGWNAVGRSASACCTAISKVFFAAKDALGAWNEARKIRNEALKAAEKTREESYEEIHQEAFNKFAEEAYKLGATVGKDENQKYVIKKVTLFEKGFLDTIRAAWSDPKKFIKEVKGKRNLQRSIAHASEGFKEIHQAMRYNRKTEIEETYEKAVEQADVTAKTAGEDYKERVQAERTRKNEPVEQEMDANLPDPRNPHQI